MIYDYELSDPKANYELSKIACLIDELNGKKEIDRYHWHGHHPNVVGKHLPPEHGGSEDYRSFADGLINELCTRLKSDDVSKRSLELQIWWRDHQIEDRKRIEKENLESLEKKAREDLKKTIDGYIEKLTPSECELFTPSERKLLNL